MSKKLGPLLLCILDGWGYSESKKCNAIADAHKPNWDKIWSEHPHTTIQTHGPQVGLPSGQMGNSEVGHVHIGAGRVVYQEYTRISRSIRTGSFFSNKTLTSPVDLAIANNKAIHIMGLLSDGGVHSHINQIKAMIRLAAKRGAKSIYLHAFLDGRDTPPKSAKKSIQEIEDLYKELEVGMTVSIIGRYFAMDRDKRWDRIEKAHNLILHGIHDHIYVDPYMALESAYQRGEVDEFVTASAIGKTPTKVEAGDVLFFMNYRTDRARQLTSSFITGDFTQFSRASVPEFASFTTLTEYKRSFNIPVAFPSSRLENSFGEYISKMGLAQLRAAETEKYAHVTFFFNGGEEDAFEGEDRILIGSPRVATYDLKPEMSALKLTSELEKAIASGKYDVIICNYANSDMVGHTGNLAAATKAIETLDECLGRLYPAIIKNGGQMLITADHGNSEQMCNYETGEPFTSHTTNLVPLIYIGDKNVALAENGSLADLAPTMLDLLNLEAPIEMTGHNLIIEK